MKIAKPVHELVLDSGGVIKLNNIKLLSNKEYIEKYLGNKKKESKRDC